MLFPGARFARALRLAAPFNVLHHRLKDSPGRLESRGSLGKEALTLITRAREWILHTFQAQRLSFQLFGEAGDRGYEERASHDQGGGVKAAVSNGEIDPKVRWTDGEASGGTDS